MRDCCNEIDDVINDIEAKERGGQQIFDWQDVAPGEVYELRDLRDNRLVEYLKLEMRLDWLEHSNIIKSEDDNEVRIFYRNKIVTIKLNEVDKTKAYLKVNRKNVRELNVGRYPNEDNSSGLNLTDSAASMVEQLGQLGDILSSSNGTKSFDAGWKSPKTVIVKLTGNTTLNDAQFIGVEIN